MNQEKRYLWYRHLKFWVEFIIPNVFYSVLFLDFLLREYRPSMSFLNDGFVEQISLYFLDLLVIAFMGFVFVQLFALKYYFFAQKSSRFKPDLSWGIDFFYSLAVGILLVSGYLFYMRESFYLHGFAAFFLLIFVVYPIENVKSCQRTRRGGVDLVFKKDALIAQKVVTLGESSLMTLLRIIFSPILLLIVIVGRLLKK